ncbi:MAG TPA: SpoIIE family protein phosphatase [Clostridia bacterium]|nr:SpoIIE family protein phosphatase [Clostridia bacterium]
MKNNLKTSTRLLSKNKDFNDKFVKLVDDKKIPINIDYDFGLEFLTKIDIVIVDKEYYMEYGLEKLYDKTKYIIYLIDESDYNIEFIEELYANYVFDIFHSSFIPDEVERKLWGLIKLLSEENTDQILDIILDSIEDSIAITNDEGILEYVNKGFLKTTGYALDEVIGKNPRVLKSDGHTPGFYKDLWETITHGNIWNGDFINISKSGELIYEEASIYPIELSSRKYLKIAHNITKKKFLENKVKLSMSLAKNVLGTSAPVNYRDSRVKFEYFVKYMNELGGDFIWFDKIGKNKYFTALVDVTGHDLSSTLILMTIINFIKEYKNIRPLAKLAEQINKYLNDFNEKSDIVKLISGIFCVVDLNVSQVQYINAGHPSGLIFEKETSQLIELKRNTLLLGVREELPFEASIVGINGKSDLILYSDGLLEYYLNDYTEISPEAYKKMFYHENKLKFLTIQKELMNKDHIKDDLSLAHLRF